MRIFLIKGLVLFAMFFAIVQGVGYWQLRTGSYERKAIGAEVYDAMRESRQKTDAPLIVLGDSVAHQVFSLQDLPRNRVHVLTCNAAISVFGQYLLLRNVADVNDLRGRDVVLVYHPDSFRFDLRDKYTYNYFIRLFYRPPYTARLSDLVSQRVRDVPLHGLVVLPAMRVGRWSPPYEPKTLSDAPDFYPHLSAVAVDGLRAIKAMASELGFTFRVLSPPINEIFHDRFDLAAMDRQIEHEGFRDLFGDYTRTLRYLPAAYFREDTIHFTGNALRASVLDPFSPDGLIRLPVSPRP